MLLKLGAVVEGRRAATEVSCGKNASALPTGGAREGPRGPKGARKSTFGVPRRHFLRPRCQIAACAITILFTMF